MNYYEVLGVSRDADPRQIKRAYFDKVKRHTPDKDPAGFKTIRLAYETLCDEKERAKYDSYFTVSDDVQGELLTARELMQQKKYREAVDYLNQLSEKRPEPAIVRLNAEAYWHLRKPGKAEALCQALLDENPRDAETLLLRAKISSTRKHRNKMKEYLEKAYHIDPANPDISTYYMYYAMQQQPRLAWLVGLGAVMANPDVFRDDYPLYLHCIYSYTTYTAQAPPVHGSEALRLQNVLLPCFVLFTECFIADKSVDKATYDNALGLLTHVARKPAYVPHIKKLLSALTQCIHYDKAEESTYNTIRAEMAVGILQADDAIHDVLAELTGCLIVGETEQDKRLSMECYIVMKLPGIRTSIKALRKTYPEYFKLHQLFYLDVLNKQKSAFLTDKYYSVYRRLRRATGGYDEETTDEYGADYEAQEEDRSLSSESAAPYVRETPKIGRNDPCPCGSGKKYKKCCGQ